MVVLGQGECTLSTKNDGVTLTGPYRGDMRFGTANGQGEVLWQGSDGAQVGRYQGSFLRGKMHGQGTFTWQSGDKYEGEWQNDMAHGKGAQIRADGSVAHSGRWAYDKPSFF